MMKIPYTFQKIPTGLIVGTLAALAMAAYGDSACAQTARSKLTMATPSGLGDVPCVLTRERGPSAGSAIIAKPLPHDSRLVIFPYDKNALFPVNTSFNRYTHFEFEDGEKIVGSYINDETDWEQKVSGTGRDIFVRPRIRGAVGSMTTITNMRRYQIDLLDISGCPSESRYQRVSWQMSDSGFYEDRDALSNSASSGRGRGMIQGLPSTAAPAAEPERDPMQISLEGMNSDYVIEGDPEFAPTMVLDDGKRTWLKFGTNLALRPALFGVSAEGTAETVEYVPHGAYFIVPKVFSHGILLKLGKREVKIRNKASSCGWFNSACSKVTTNNMFGGQ